MEKNFDDAKKQKNADSDAHRQQQCGAVHHSAHLAGQHRKVGLGYGDEHAHQKADEEQHRQLAGFGQALADMLAHGSHGHIGTEVEETDAQNQQDGRTGKHAQFFS